MAAKEQIGTKVTDEPIDQTAAVESVGENGSEGRKPRRTQNAEIPRGLAEFVGAMNKPVKRTSGRKNQTYGDSHKRLAAYAVMVEGTVPRAARQCGIPSNTIYEWMAREEEWERLSQPIREKVKCELAARFTGLIYGAIDATDDRIRNGDWKYTKDQGLIRIPMGGRELAIVAAIATDKRAVLSMEPTSITASADGRVSNMLERLERLGRADRAKIIDAEVVSSESSSG